MRASSSSKANVFSSPRWRTSSAPRRSLTAPRTAQRSPNCASCATASSRSNRPISGTSANRKPSCPARTRALAPAARRAARGPRGERSAPHVASVLVEYPRIKARCSSRQLAHWPCHADQAVHITGLSFDRRSTASVGQRRRRREGIGRPPRRRPPCCIRLRATMRSSMATSGSHWPRRSRSSA